MAFEDSHAQALAQVRGRGGVAVDFTPQNRAAGYDAASDTFGTLTVPETVSGWALEVTANEAEMTYTSRDLVILRRVVLLFVPGVMGDVPEIGSSVEWSGEPFTVAERFPLRPAGSAILSRVLIAQ